jgi:putative membrane protein
MRFALIAVAVAGLAFARAPSANAADTAQDFVNQAAVGGLFEVEAGGLARTSSESPDLRAFAMMLEADHRKANARLKEVATAEKLTVPDALDSTHAAKLKDLKATKTGFDAKFLDQQQAAHEKTIALFKSYAGGGDNKQLKALASDMLPTLKQHLDQVQRLKTGLPNENDAPKPVKPIN